MQHYNYDRTNQGRHCQGRTPATTLDEGYKLYKKYVIDGEPTKDKKDKPETSFVNSFINFIKTKIGCDKKVQTI